MSTAADSSPPKREKKLCVDFPKNKPFSIPLPFGGELKSLVDPSKGPPTDCTLAHSLMLQITPMLAGMTCVFKILKFLTVFKKALSAKPTPIISAVPDLIQSLEELSGCFGLINFANIVAMIKAILQLVLAYIGCLIDGFESLRNFQVGIDLAAEGGTPLVLGSIECAKKNADTSAEALLGAMEGVQPLMEIIGMIGEIVGQDIALPKMNLTPGGDDPLQPLIDFRDALQEIVDTLPG